MSRFFVAVLIAILLSVGWSRLLGPDAALGASVTGGMVIGIVAGLIFDPFRAWFRR